jgi:hypothetical protein
MLAQFDREGITSREDDFRYLTDKGKDWYKERYRIEIKKPEKINKTGYSEMEQRKKY